MRKRSLGRTAFFLICVLAIGMIGTLIAFFFLVVGGKLQSHANITVAFYLEQMAYNTESAMDSVRSVLWSMIGDSAVQETMRQHPPMTPLDRIEVEKQLNRSLLYNVAWDTGCINGLLLMKTPDDYYCMAHTRDIAAAEARLREASVHFAQENSTKDIFPSQSNSDYAYLVVDYVDLVTMKPNGKLIIEMRLDKLLPVSALKELFPGAEVVFQRRSGAVIRRDGHLEEQPDWSQTETKDRFRWNGKTYSVHWNELPKTRAKIGICLSEKEILGDLVDTIWLFVLFALFVLLLALLTNTLLYRRLLRPIRSMIGSIDRVASGDLQTRMSSTPYYETEVIANSFNGMVHRLQELFTENYEKALLLRESEYAGLEAQIDPHFIFNVLEVINLRCMEAGRHDICKIVNNLAQLIRSNVSHKGEQKASIRDELTLARFYLELQQQRFDAALQYEINIEDESLLDLQMPRLSIEPLVENSVVHGLENKVGGGKIQIGIWEEDDGVCICVSDDGVGFDMKEYRQRQCAEKETPRHNHVALSNIERRIQLLYGTQYGLNIRSEPGSGTSVRMLIPYDKT